MPKYITYEETHDVLINLDKFAVMNNRSEAVIAIDYNEACEELKKIPSDPDVVKVTRCINCYHANEDGTICRHGVGKHTDPDNFCMYGVTRNES